MMNKVYLIMVGEYSDRRCVGYCTTQEEAERYCAVKNRLTIDSYDRYEIEEQKCLDGKLIGRVMTGKSQTFAFKLKNGEWTRSIYTGDPEICCKHKTIVRKWNGDGAKVTVWQKKYDEEKAIKIATDALYQWYAERTIEEKEFYEKLEKYILTNNSTSRND